MDAEKTNFYEAADRAIKAMNRDALSVFGWLKAKTTDWDELNIIRTVKTIYHQEEKKARQRYYEISVEAYILGLMLCGMGSREAHRRAEKAITREWVEKLLSEPDMVTGYRFDTETERKAERLTESLAAAEEAPDGTGLGKNAVIDKALKDWTRMFAQVAIGVTDAALIQAYEDVGAEEVEWRTAMDERVCKTCGPLHGRVFKLEDVPPKPHWQCRCRLVPVRTEKGKSAKNGGN